jgi:dihydrofolate synthase/folylpolyglutamate synthase
MDPHEGVAAHAEVCAKDQAEGSPQLDLPPLRRKEWHGFQPTLTRIQGVLRRLGHPERAVETILVGGTNGKGTVSCGLARAWGSGTGCFTSPHLIDVRERVTIDGTMLPVAAWQRAYDELHKKLEDNELSYFEWLLVLALHLFRAEGIQRAVFELGLGGRLDATNSLDPRASLLCSVELDHCEWLGHTREAIALEKIEIARAGRPFIAPAYLADWSSVVQRMHAMGCHWQPVPLPRPTRYHHNLLTLQKACAVLGFHQPEALPAMPGRRMELRPGLLLDGAHNPMGWQDLAAFIGERGMAPIRILAGLSEPRSPAQFLEIMRPVARSISVWPTGFDRELPGAAWPSEVSVVDEVTWRGWLEEPLLVCGSLYLVGAFLRAFGYQPSGW